MSNGTYTINKKMIFTSFDSGSWHIPAFKFRLEQNKLSKIFSTDSVRIDVGYAASDSTNQLRDIKPILEVTVKDNRNMYIIAGIVLLIICIVLFYLYLKRRKPKTVPVFHNALSPFDEAMKALADLKQFDPGKSDQLKAYYSALTGIFKKYCSRKMDKNLMNKTTGDILISLNNKFNNPDLVSMLAIALRSADAVKFAKYVPDVSASDLSKEQIRSVIELMEKE